MGRHGFDPWDGKISWGRKWQSTPVFLPGESHGERNPEGYSPQGYKESDMKEHTHTHRHQAKNKETCINFHILNWSERLDFLGESKEKEIVAYKWIIMILSIDKKKKAATM